MYFHLCHFFRSPGILTRLKGLWITLLTALLAFATIGLVPLILASTLIRENFNSYNLNDDIVNVSDWEGDNGFLIKDDYVVTGYSLANQAVSARSVIKYFDATTTTNVINAEINLNVVNCPGTNYRGHFGIESSPPNQNYVLSIFRCTSTTKLKHQLSVGGSIYEEITDLDENKWYKIEYTFNPVNEVFQYNFDARGWSEEISYPATGTDEFLNWVKIGDDFSTSNFYVRFDDLDISDVSPNSSLEITSPTSGTTASTTFDLDFSYNLAEENINKAFVVFEAWSTSSTCPIYGTDEWQTEYNNGWFYSQSMPYFSPRLTSQEGTSTISVYNLDEFYYNCNRCYFYNEDTQTSDYLEKCPGYLLNVSGYISPSQPLPIGSWQSYYASHTDEKFATSTAIFDAISNSFTKLFEKITSFINDFKNLFDSSSAYAKGEELGSKVPMARGFLEPINGFFGNLPVSELFIFCILILIVMNVYQIIKTILQLIRG